MSLPAGGTGAAASAPSRFRALLLGLFRIDQRPEPPPGAPESLRVFRASPRYFGYSLLGWAAGQIGALFGLLFSTIGFGFVSAFSFVDIDAIDIDAIDFGPWTRFAEAAWPLLIVLYLAQLVLSFVVLRLGWEMRWYMVSDRALRIRHGIFSLREQTVTVLNIQNMQVKRGPVQRLFGIADLEIRTASGGGSDDDEDSLNRALLQGLDDADEVRDLLLAALRNSRDAGLGDPDDEAAPALPPPSRSGPDDGPGGTLEAARELLAACRALRVSVSGPSSENGSSSAIRPSSASSPSSADC